MKEMNVNEMHNDYCQNTWMAIKMFIVDVLDKY
jgi:hypothetical protein